MENISHNKNSRKITQEYKNKSLSNIRLITRFMKP